MAASDERSTGLLGRVVRMPHPDRLPIVVRISTSGRATTQRQAGGHSP